LSEVVALVLIVLLAGSGYAAGRLHGQLSYRMGYRFGYRQGYFDGDRSSWNRRRRELQAAVASVLTTPIERRAEAYPAERPTGTTYTSSGIDEPSDEFVEVPVPGPLASNPRDDWSIVDALPKRR
jgi:hypothetical protein